MNDVNRTLYIPLYGKSKISKQNIILRDPVAEEIWEQEAFPIHGKSKSRWLAYNMAMRARVFDEWTEKMLRQNENALVLHIGCGLDSRCTRIKAPYVGWIDCDLPDVIAVRRKYYTENDRYRMIPLDASDLNQIRALPDNNAAIVILEGLSMYLTNKQMHGLLQALKEKYLELHILMDVYTGLGARASKYRNPVNDVGVTVLYGVDNLDSVIGGLTIRLAKEFTFTPKEFVDELPPADRLIFKLLFTGRLYRKLYRLYELEA